VKSLKKQTAPIPIAEEKSISKSQESISDPVELEPDILEVVEVKPLAEISSEMADGDDEETENITGARVSNFPIKRRYWR